MLAELFTGRWLPLAASPHTTLGNLYAAPNCWKPWPEDLGDVGRDGVGSGLETDVGLAGLVSINEEAKSLRLGVRALRGSPPSQNPSCDTLSENTAPSSGWVNATAS